jgi:hypothetical protein
MRPIRVKSCAECQTIAPVLFRVRANDTAPWQFVCQTCLPHIKDNNPNYIYGGTWKAQKRD